MARKLIAFLRLSRPLFLLGGVLLYALGALIARYQGAAIDLGLYWRGQLSVTALQLMTHYLNEYWDVEADCLNHNRTLFSGGSGVLVRDELPRKTAFTAAVVCLAVATVMAIRLIFTYAVPPSVWVILLLGFMGAYFYSSPPLTLSSSGYGELTTSIVVAGLVPALSHVVQARQLSFLVLLATAPLVMLHLAMLLAFEFPDFLSDEAAGKQTLLVRLGRRTGARLHNALIFLALSLAGAAAYIGLPAQVALAVVLTSPLALLQISLVRRLQRGDPVSFARLAFQGLLLFVLAASFAAFSFWAIGTGWGK
jgi:1,4-dihydroxy-2-naphthoate polyprenyltransferase